MVDFVKRLALGCVVALAFFVVIEVILMAAGVVPLYERADPYVGFSGYSPLFVERTMPDGERVFETAPNKLRWFNPQQFPARKSPGVTRLFCLGGSTTYGRPYDDRTSFCGWLRAFLPAVDPGRQWEVINAGGISYASYRVVRLMEALAEYDPDMFIVYTGHNEFLEERTYGKLLKTPEFVRDLASLASRMRLYSALSDFTYERGDVLSTEVQAVLDRSVGPEDYYRNDEMRGAVLDHLRTSLERMTRIAERAGARMILVTPASNIADFSPFKADPSGGMSEGDLEQVSALKRDMVAAMDEGNASQAVLIGERALALDPRDAELLYQQGRALRAVGRIDEARRAFIAARDEDIAPLRALSPVRGIVADVARENGTGFVDFAHMVDEQSPDGIPGSGSFLDHVHPTIEGNRMLALAIVDEMARDGAVVPAPTWTDAAIAEISRRVEESVDDQARALALKSLSNVLLWAGKHDEAERLVNLAVETTAEDFETHHQRATLLRREGRDQEALTHFEEAVRLAPGNPAVRMAFGILLSDLGRKAEARRELETVVRLDGAHPGAHYELGVVLKDLGRLEGAESAYRTALELDPNNADAYNNLGVIVAMRGDLAAAAELFTRALRADPDHANATENLALAREAMRP
ncbi:MAG: tetratricopeptide repeat protein [Rhodothermales bacterium]|nr:tetratricopeptide repeat protein [Rhodothermales bacterium]